MISLPPFFLSPPTNAHALPQVYKQERFERERLSRRAGQPEKGQDGGVLAAAPSNPAEHKRSANGRPTIRHVDSIIEDEEEPTGSLHPPAPPLQSNGAVRSRNTSFTASSTTSSSRPSDQRLRSVSISNVPHPRHEDGIARKGSNSRNGVPRLGGIGSQNVAPMPPPAGVPKRTRKIQRNPESLDLDEVMAGSDGEDGGTGESTQPSRGGQQQQQQLPSVPSTPTSPRKPHVSRAAQDLIAFLDAGPPEDPSYNPAMNASVISFESSKTRSGRLQRMMSRLAIGGSRENLNGALDDPPKTPRSLSRKPSKANMAASPPPSFKGLNSKRSIPNVASQYPAVIVATPPPRPPSQTLYSNTPPASNSQTSSLNNSEEGVSSQPASLARRGTRKAVPTLEGSVTSPSSSVADSLADSKPAINGHANGHRTARILGTTSDDTSSIASGPTSPPARNKPVVLNGYPVKLDMSETSLRPRAVTSAASPSSMVDRKSIHTHSKAESGYASRSASRSPVTPSDRLPPPPPPAPPAPTLSATDAEDMRRLLGNATSAEECRLVVDLFLAKNGFALAAPAPPPEAVAAPSVEDALVLAAKNIEEAERGLVALFLGGGGGAAGEGVDADADARVDSRAPGGSSSSLVQEQERAAAPQEREDGPGKHEPEQQPEEDRHQQQYAEQQQQQQQREEQSFRAAASAHSH